MGFQSEHGYPFEVLHLEFQSPMGMHGFSKPIQHIPHHASIIVSIPDGDAWVFKVCHSICIPIHTVVSIPDGDAWVFKAHACGGDWNAVKPSFCESLAVSAIFCLHC
jgi:hypothetical protein